VFLLAQLSDLHVGADWGGGDPEACLAAAVDSVLAVRPRPDAVLVSGDLVDHGTDAECARVRELLAPLRAPLHVVAGNHDDRAALRRAFDLPGAGSEPVQYAADLGPLRLVVLDTTIPGEDAGDLDAARLAWVDAELAHAPDVPTVLAMHHPPLVTGVPIWDELGLAADARRGLADVLARHPQVDRVVAGHLHRTLTTTLAGCAVVSIPSTYIQGRLDFSAHAFELADDPPGFALHALVDGQLVSHIEPIRART
jgi:3',5'-cyclic AMP phosphodiesterase CpdA